MPSTQDFLVYGAGGHGKVVADVGVSMGLHLVGFLDDREELQGSEHAGVPVFHRLRAQEPDFAWKGVPVALGVGDNAGREQAARTLAEAGFHIVTLIHRAAVVSPSARLGEGTVMMAGAVVNPDARVGAGVILNTGCVVEHDCVLGDYVHLSPNSALGGGVVIGARTHLGLGAVARPLVQIGADVRVGAGAAVIRDIPDGLTVVGVPAKAIGG
jgi:sugar O-acyltransferase (sialic acid O-acetyltransferase NeuD family)